MAVTVGAAARWAVCALLATTGCACTCTEEIGSQQGQDAGGDAAIGDAAIRDAVVDADASCTTDLDGDGAGPGCAREDCDDTDPDTIDECGTGCESHPMRLGCPCDPHVRFAPCYMWPSGIADIGICRSGLKECVDFRWGTCDGQVLPPESVEETCNDIDDDCDGTVDEGRECGLCRKRCENGAREICRIGIGGCPQWLQTDRPCDGTEHVDLGCAPGESWCDGNVLETCAAGADGCPELVEQDCSTEFCVDRNDGRASCVWCTADDICDPDCGLVGAPCLDSDDCGDVGSLRCLTEEISGLPGGYCGAKPSLWNPSPCDPEDDRTCPAAEHGVCLVSAPGASYCFRSCELTDDNWASSNCGCRAGYQCDLSTEACMLGCRTDEEGEARDCCTRSEDGDLDGVPDGEIRIEDCRASCDPATFRCVTAGAEGAAIGEPCLSYQDCPQNGRCLIVSSRGDPGPEWSSGSPLWLGGYCVLDACDLEGRECPGDSYCASVGGADPGLGPRRSISFAFGRPLVYRTCLAACTVGDDRVADPFADPNPACREGYGCTVDPDLAAHDACASDDECHAGRHCIGGVCDGNGFCSPLGASLEPHVRFCDTSTHPDTGCPRDDPATADWDEAQRCVDGVCQAPCGAGHACAGDTTCDGGYCRWGNAGGPCANADGAANDGACVSPFGQGFCAWGDLFGADGTCLIASCDAPGMAEHCTEGRTCEHVFGGSYCLAACEVPAEGCAVAEECQGEAVGCRDGFSCHHVQEGSATGVCLASCSEQEDPDGFCARNLGEPLLTCDLVTGTCVE